MIVVDIETRCLQIMATLKVGPHPDAPDIAIVTGSLNGKTYYAVFNPRSARPGLALDLSKRVVALALMAAAAKGAM